MSKLSSAPSHRSFFSFSLPSGPLILPRSFHSSGSSLITFSEYNVRSPLVPWIRYLFSLSKTFIVLSLFVSLSVCASVCQSAYLPVYLSPCLPLRFSFSILFMKLTSTFFQVVPLCDVTTLSSLS
jgi:hypothetical protein